LSIDLVPLPHVVSSNYPNLALKQICVADMPHEDLLSHFEESIRYVCFTKFNFHLFSLY
jgi:hypothetical protein